MSDTRPEDLVSVEEAARRVDRSKSTVRAWVRSGELTGYREDPERPGNSRLLVSAAELLSLVVVAGKVANPGRIPARAATAPPMGEGSSEDVASLKSERDQLRAGMIDALRGNVAALEGRIQDLVRAVASEQTRAEEWRARALAAEAEREALRAAQRLPWWRRLLSAPADTPPTPMLSSEDEGLERS